MRLVKKSTLRKISAFLTIYLSMSMTVVPAMAQMTGDVLSNSHGGANITGSEGSFTGFTKNGADTANLNFDGSGKAAHIKWGQLSVGSGQELNFLNGKSLVLNSVNAGANMSVFAGLITAQEGRIVISNPAGILFSGGKFVSSGPLTLTTSHVELSTANPKGYEFKPQVDDDFGAGKIGLDKADIFAGGEIELLTENGGNFIAIAGQPSEKAGEISMNDSLVTIGETDEYAKPQLVATAAGDLMVVNGTKINFVKKSFDVAAYEAAVRANATQAEKYAMINNAAALLTGDAAGVAKLTSHGDLTVKDSVVNGSLETEVKASLKGEEVISSEKGPGAEYYDELATLLGEENFLALTALLDKVDVLDTLTMDFSIGNRTLVVNLVTGDWTVRNNGGNITASGNSGGFTKGQFQDFIKNLMEAEVTKFRSFETHGKLDISGTTISEALTTTAVNTKLDGVNAKDITINTIDDVGGGRVFERSDVVVSFDVTTALEQLEDFELALQGTTIVVPSSAFPNNPDVVVSLYDLPDIKTLVSQFKTEITKLENVSKSVSEDSSKLKLGETTPFVRGSLDTNNVVAENKITLNTNDVTELVSVKNEGGENTWALDNVASGNFEAKHLEINSAKGAIAVDGVTLSDVDGKGDMTLNAATGKNVDVTDVVVGGALVANGKDVTVGGSNAGSAKINAADKVAIDNSTIGNGVDSSTINGNEVAISGGSSVKKGNITATSNVDVQDSLLTDSTVTAGNNVTGNGNVVGSTVTADKNVALNDVTGSTVTAKDGDVTAGNVLAKSDVVASENVKVAGDIKDSKVEAEKGDVTAGNVLEGSDVVAGSNVKVTKDISASNVKAKNGNVEADNILAKSDVTASDDVKVASDIKNSTVEAEKGDVTAKNVVGSTVIAGKGVAVKEDVSGAVVTAKGGDVTASNVSDSIVTASDDAKIADQVAGSTVSAGNDITVGGGAEDSTLTAGRDITLQSGVGEDAFVVVGDVKAKAGRNLTAKNLVSPSDAYANLDLTAGKVLDVNGVNIDGNLTGVGETMRAQNVEATGDVQLGLTTDDEGTINVIPGSVIEYARNIVAGGNVGLFADKEVNASDISANEIYLFADKVTGDSMKAEEGITARSNNADGDYSVASEARLSNVETPELNLIGFDDVYLADMAIDSLNVENLRNVYISGTDLARINPDNIDVLGDDAYHGQGYDDSSNSPGRFYQGRILLTNLFPRVVADVPDVLEISDNDLYARVGEWIGDGLTQIAPVSFSAEDEDELQLRKRNFLKNGRVRKENRIVHVLDSFRAY